MKRRVALVTLGLLAGVACGGEAPDASEGAEALSGTVTPLPGRLQLEDYANGGEGVAYHDTTPGNAGGAYRKDDVDIQTTTDPGGNYDIGWTVAGEWLKYATTIASAGDYDLTMRMASNATSPTTVHVLVDGQAVGAKFTLESGDGWQSWHDVVVRDIPLSAGSHTLKLVVDTDGVNVDYLDVARSATTLFGINGNGGASTVKSYGKLPISRVYNGSATLNASTCFAAGGFCYTGAHVGEVGIVSGKRLNMSVIFNPTQVTSASSTLAKQFQSFAAGVPDGWYVQLVMYHEYNLHTSDYGGDGASGGSTADFKKAFPILAQAIVNGDAGRGRCVPVINPAWDHGALESAQVPAASAMPVTTQLHMDIYDNPEGQPKGYHNYGTSYDDGATMPAMYSLIGSLGYLTANHGWGIDEFNAPRRVAPALAKLDTTLGWGPLSPHDLDGSGQAASITAMASFAVNAAVPATTVILFIGQGNWNQRFETAGTADQDAPANNPNHQGWPIAVDPSKPLAAFGAFLDTSL